MHRSRLLVVALLALTASACGASPSPPAPPRLAAPPTAAAAEAAKDTAPSHSLSAPGSWSRSSEAGVERLTSPEGDVEVLLVVVDGDATAAERTAWDRAGRKRSLPERTRVRGAPSERFSEQLVVTYVDAEGERAAQAVALVREGRAYVFLIEGPIKSLTKRGAEVSQIVDSLELAGAPRTELVASRAQPLSAAKREALLAFVETARELTGAPGAAVAIVAGDEIVTRGYGVRRAGGAEKVDGDTQFMIGSVTKSFSTLLLATLVDDGKLAWTTPAREAHPDFRLASEERTAAVNIEHLFCACIGAARRDMELLFEFGKVRPADVIGQLARMELTTGFGETFQYNNQLTAAGGYIAGRVANPAVKDLSLAYRKALQDRVLGPLGMGDTTPDPDAVTRRRQHAHPHHLDWSGQSLPLELALERFVLPYAPAGALWSTANDMAKYIRLQLGRGALPGGRRLVSEENLARTQTAKTKVDASTGYGMGWLIGKSQGLHVVEHSGGTMGFASDVAFFPELGVGLYVVVNRSSGSGLHGAVRERLLELLFDLEPKAEAKLRHRLGERDRLQAEARAKVTAEPVPSELFGRYREASLGDVELYAHKGGVLLDAGEWTASVGVLDPKEAPASIVLTSGPLQGLPLRRVDSGGRPTLVLKHGQVDYVFERR